jgi:hypothetical protein
MARVWLDMVELCFLCDNYKMKKTFLLLLFIILAGFCIYLVAKNYVKEPVTSAVDTNEPTHSSISPKASENSQVTWVFKVNGTDSTTGAPITKVTATIAGKNYDAGTYKASCSVVDVKNLSRIEYINAVSGILCWWAGFGDEVAVFNENQHLVIKHREVQEGSAESVGVVTSFKTILIVK